MTEAPGVSEVPALAGVTNGLSHGWQVVRDSEPVVNATCDQANAVPAGVDWPMRLTQGTGPNYLTFWFRTYRPGGEPASAVRMRLYWVYGARYLGGGAFIPNAWLDLLDCRTAAGSTVNIDVTVLPPRNHGTATAPNAYLPISIRCEDSAGDSAVVQTRVFCLYGTGHFEEYCG
jgi:hypothetical protein